MEVLETIIKALKSIFDIIITLLVSLGIISGSSTNETKQTKVFDISAIGELRTVQGACTDGANIYFSIVNSAGTTGKIIKVSALNFQTISESDNLNLDHANDLTYVAKTNEIFVSNNEPNYTRISVINAETLTITKTIELSRQVYSIEYVGTNDCYYAGISFGYNIVKYDSSFKELEVISLVDNGYTRQGITVHNQNLYCIYSGKNYIAKYDLNGTLIGELKLPVQTDEAESLFFVGEALFVVYNIPGVGNGGTIYRLDNVQFEQIGEK